VLDSSQKIASALDYEPFGYVNRVALDRETLHPYPNNYAANIADFTQPIGGPLLALKMRVLLHMVDVEDGPGDYAILKDGDPPQSALTPPIGGYHRGQMWTPWVQPQAGHIIMSFISDGQNCCPDGMGGLICTPPNVCQNYPYQGIVMEAYEYQRYQIGAAPFGIPLRFPGQYFDAESNLVGNWNRYYDPSIGRYLQPEPLLLKEPDFIVADAQIGADVQPYAYALNNPIAFSDPDGFHSDQGCQFGSSCNACRAQALRMVAGALRDCVLNGCSDQSFKLKCDDDAKKACKSPPAQAKGKKNVKKGGSSRVGSPEDPVREILWCELPMNEDCQAQALVHELAHACGWPFTHPPGHNIPAEGDGVLKNCGKKLR